MEIPGGLGGKKTARQGIVLMGATDLVRRLRRCRDGEGPLLAEISRWAAKLLSGCYRPKAGEISQ